MQPSNNWGLLFRYDDGPQSVCFFIRLDPIISHVPVQEVKLSAVRFAVDSQVIRPQNESAFLGSYTGIHNLQKNRPDNFISRRTNFAEFCSHVGHFAETGIANLNVRVQNSFY